ncbi:MAG: GNAT family N-acetyltransferase [Bdellovibrionota bacterium]
MAKLIPEKFKLKDGREVLLKSPIPDEWVKMRDFINLIKMESQNTFQFPGQPVLEETATRARIQKAADSSKSLCVDVEFEGRFIAQMDFWPVHSIEDHPWLKHNCYFGMTVIKEFWQQGLARKLLEVLESEAKKMGYTHIRAEVRASNDRGVKLYTNFGFKITGSKEEFAFIDGKFHDDLYITKKI